jgi:hypothetical protein
MTEPTNNEDAGQRVWAALNGLGKPEASERFSLLWLALWAVLGGVIWLVLLVAAWSLVS